MPLIIYVPKKRKVPFDFELCACNSCELKVKSLATLPLRDVKVMCGVRKSIKPAAIWIEGIVENQYRLLFDDIWSRQESLAKWGWSGLVFAPIDIIPSYMYEGNDRKLEPVQLAKYEVLDDDNVLVWVFLEGMVKFI